MKLDEQVDKVFNLLYSNKDKFLSIFEMRELLNEQINSHDIEMVLDLLLAKDLIIVKNAVFEGIEVNLLIFCLNIKGRLFYENPKPEKNKIDKEYIPNPFPRIFKNLESFQFFESLTEDVRKRYLLADYSFIYRRMQKDDLIYKYITDGEYREFLLNEYDIEIEKTKLLDYCKTDEKEKSYLNKKNRMK